jgi:DNA-binding transcriptional LysR family regulator
MTLNQLEYFCAVCRCHSISRAAEELYVSQPTISTSIRELEREFHLQLFSHGKNRIALTPDGDAFYRRAAEILEGTRSLTDDFLALGASQRPVRIGIPPIMSTIFFPRLTDQFHEVSDIPVRLVEYGSVRACEMVASGNLDLSLINMDVYDLEKFNSFPLMETGCVFCVSRTHPLAKEKQLTFGQLRDENLILFNTDSVLNQLVNHRFRAMHATPHILMESSQLYTILNVVRGGNCGTFLFSPIAANPRDFVEIPVVPTIKSHFGIVWNRGPVREDVKTFLDFARTVDFTPYTESSAVPSRREEP